MGTSGSSSGSGSGTPLVPSWLGGGDSGALPGGDDPPTPDGNDGDDDQGTPQSPDSNPKPPIPPVAAPERFRSARTNFSRFAGSGGSDGRALRRAVRDYVRSGTGGSANAVRRMGTARSAASNALGVFRGIQRDGVQETLRRLNLQSFAGRPIQDIFVGLTEVICQDGGTIDEAITRDAWLETIASLEQFDIEDSDALSADQIQEVFLSFVAHTVEARLYQEIGVNGFKFSEDLQDIEGFDKQFRDYIERSVRDSFACDLSDMADFSDNEIRDIVDKTYLDAWDLLETLGDREG
ncbi:MAG: hypothetical protein GY815_12155 [Gammaproteobacteria bacterium]|nr:hypothetical protein [Gammaproteobacteria bacterium]